MCRVDGDFYLVNSSFEFFPGVPLYHSRNLADWELLGYCLNTEEQLNLKEAHASGEFMHRRSGGMKASFYDNNQCI